MTDRRTRIAVWLSNFILYWLASPRYRAKVVGAVEYGLRAAARDAREGIPPPPDWRR